MKYYGRIAAALNRSIKINSNDTRLIARRDEIRRQQERYEKAEAHYSQIIERDPGHVWAIAHRGETKRLLERYQEALIDFNRAVDLSPDYAWAVAHRGATYRLMNDYFMALTDLNQAIKLNPTYAWAYAYRARTYQLLECYEEMLADFDRAVALDETMFSDWRSERGMLLSYLGQFAEAVACCQQALQKNPDNHFASYNLAVFKVRWQGLAKSWADVHNARTVLRRLINTETPGLVLYCLGGVAALEGKINQALAYLEEAILLEEEAFKLARDDLAWLELRTDQRFQSLILIL